MKKIYYGQETKRALENFPFSKNPAPIELILSITEIKKAAAIANWKTNKLDQQIKNAIVKACDEILLRKYDTQFVTPGLQGGAGTSINMNVNEVIASLATEFLNKRGKKITVHPLNHVNMSQSTNDVNPSALKITCIRLTNKLLKDMVKIVEIFAKKAKEFASISKLGRTHLQDAVPTTLGEEFASYTAIISRDSDRIKNVINFFYEFPLGGTAIGNSINASTEYILEVYNQLSSLTGLTFRPAKNLMSQTSSQTDFCLLSQALVLLCLDMSKIASDTRLLSSGPLGGIGEIRLKELQAGSSIMPGKVNPVLSESVNQLYFLVSGHNLTIEHAAHASQLELGIMFPLIADRLVLSLKLTREILLNFAIVCVSTITANEDMCRYHLERSTAYATLLTPRLGYDKVKRIVKEAVKSGKTIREIILQDKIMTESEFDMILNTKK